MKWIFKGICIAAVITLIVLGFGFVTMHLWNWLMPEIFGLKLITFSQAVGLLILGKILFGGFKGGRGCGHRGGPPWRRHWQNKMSKMTPEEKDRWKKRWEDKMANMSPEKKEQVMRRMRDCGWGSWKDDCGDEKISPETDSKI